MTGSNTQHITRVINVMRKHHDKLQQTYLSTVALLKQNRPSHGSIKLTHKIGIIVKIIPIYILNLNLLLLNRVRFGL